MDPSLPPRREPGSGWTVPSPLAFALVPRPSPQSGAAALPVRAQRVGRRARLSRRPPPRTLLGAARSAGVMSSACRGRHLGSRAVVEEPRSLAGLRWSAAPRACRRRGHRRRSAARWAARGSGGQARRGSPRRERHRARAQPPRSDSEARRRPRGGPCCPTLVRLAREGPRRPVSSVYRDDPGISPTPGLRVMSSKRGRAGGQGA